MTALPILLRHRTGYGVSSLATPGFRARLLHDTGGHYRKLFKFGPTPTRLAVTSLAAQAGDRVGTGTGGALAHGANHERGPVHEAEYPFHGKENVV